MKEPSFVYHGKRRFFLLFGQKSAKKRKNRASERSIGFSGARFFVFRTRKRSKMLVYFLRFLVLQRTPKRVEGEGFESRLIIIDAENLQFSRLKDPIYVLDVLVRRVFFTAAVSTCSVLYNVTTPDLNMRFPKAAAMRRGSTSCAVRITKRANGMAARRSQRRSATGTTPDTEIFTRG